MTTLNFRVTSNTGLGLTPDFPAKRAKDIRDANKKSGIYWIQPTGSASPIEVYCDMESDDGGWMCVFTCFPRLTSCYVSGASGGIPTPFDASMNKFDDSVIQNMLNDGEKTTRSFWFQRSVGGSQRSNQVFSDGNIRGRGAQWNEFDDPFAWVSNSSSSGATFRRRWGNQNWSGTYTSAGRGCSGAVGGWSNYYQQSCVQSWYAGCEGGPAINHRCAGSIQDRAEKITIWVR